jgi:hypothetical protein
LKNPRSAVWFLIRFIIIVPLIAFLAWRLYRVLYSAVPD